jgi:hypothetical protein
VIHFVFKKVILLYRVATEGMRPVRRMKTMIFPRQTKIPRACQSVRAAKIQTFMSAAFGHSK